MYDICTVKYTHENYLLVIRANYFAYTIPRSNGNKQVPENPKQAFKKDERLKVFLHGI
jgi:hypothetical protein